MNRWSSAWAILAVGLTQVSPADELAANCNADPKILGISMFLQNFHGCFISEKFSERLARLIMEEKYTSSLFVAGSSVVTDGNDVWRVTFQNKLPSNGKDIRPSEITIAIRKANGAVVDLPAEPPNKDKKASDGHP